MGKKKIKKLKNLVGTLEEIMLGIDRRVRELGVNSSDYGTALQGLDRRLRALETYNQRLFDLEKAVTDLRKRHTHAHHT